MRPISSRTRAVRAGIGLTLAIAPCAFAAGHAGGDTPAARAAALVRRMSLQQKVDQLQSEAPAIPALGVPAYTWWNEGLHGNARNGVATVFPQATGLAASWDPSLLHAVGRVVSTEARAKFNAIGAGHDHHRYQGLTIWSPNINILRDPRWGRGMETYGEDPYLTGQLAAAFVRGIQGDDPAHPRAIATPKHFDAHSGPEPGRHGFDVDLSPHDLEATYLPAFRAAVIQGHADSVMCAYNAIHGVPVCAAPWLLGGILRKDWGFRGFVVSDCDAIDDMTHFHYFKPDNVQSSAAAIKAGTDLDCGSAYAGLYQAVKRGDVAESVLDTSLERLFTARYRLGELGHDRRYAGIGMDQVDSPAHRTLALKAAEEAMVLLKNAHGTLPLKGHRQLAVIGPDADTTETLEANYHGTARDPVTPLMGLRRRFGAADIHYAQGSPVAAGVPIPVPESALRTGRGQDARAGLLGHYYANTTFSGKPAVVRTDRHIDFDWDHAAPAAGLGRGHYAVRWTGELLPPGPGDYTLAVHVDRCFDCAGHDRVRLYVDGRQVIADSGDGKHMTARLHFGERRAHAIRLDMVHSGQDQGVRLQWLAPASAQLARARRVIAGADAVVAFIGLSPDVEGEALQIDVPGFDGGDRTDIGLPAAQRALLERAAASGKPLIVVLMSGSSVAIDWASRHAAAILAAWYPGEQGGTAIARTLAGDYNPGGRLPMTFYRATKDLPAYASYAMKGRTYRYFDGTPLYPFGYGLSYTRFGYSDATLSTPALQAGKPLEVKVTVSNQGDRAGDEVAQLYLRYPASDTLAPRRALIGFRRLHLAPGEHREVTFTLNPRLLSVVDAAGHRSERAGRYRLFVGGGQPGTTHGVEATFTIQGHMALPR